MAKKHIAPTLRQKIKIYSLLVQLVAEGKAGCRCICDAMQDAQTRLGYCVNPEYQSTHRWKMYGENNPFRIGDNHMAFNFPELLAKKPKDKAIGWFWWNVDKKGKAKRVKVLYEILHALQEELYMEKLHKKKSKSNL